MRERCCVKSLSPPRSNGELPFLEPFCSFLFCAAGRGKSLSAPPKSQAPGKGWCIPEPQNSFNTRQTYTRTHTDTKVNDRSSSSNKPPTLGLRMRLESHGPAGLPLSGAMCCPAATSLPYAPSAYGLGSSSRPGKAPAALRGLPLLKLQPLGSRGLRRPRWLCSRGSCLSAPACRSRSAPARRLPGRPPPPPLPLGRPRGFSVGVPRS